MKNIPLHWKIIIGLVLGILWAIASTSLGWKDFTLDYINPFGVIFINLLKLIAVPLVLFSVIKGMTDLKDIGRLGRMGLKTIIAYLFTTVLAITIGLTMVGVFQPGKYVDDDQRVINRMSYELWVNESEDQQILDGKNFLGDPQYEELRAVAADRLSELSSNELVQEKQSTRKKVKDSGPLQFLVDMVPSNIFLSLNDTLMLQVIFFAIFFGVTLVLINPNKAEPVVDFVDGANEVFLKMVDIIMQAAPFFVFALMAGKLVEMAGDDLGALVELFKGLSAYMLVVVLGLAIMVFLIYPVIYSLVIGRKRHISFTKSYASFFRGMGPAQLLAFSTSSSAATLPVTMDCVNDNLKVSKEVTSFVLPVGATVNMDGTSLYQAIAVIFLAQMHFVDLSIAQQATIVLTATLASIGSAAVPSAGLIMMMIVLESVGLPPAWIAIVFPVDRILDMCRTVVNVTGDATVSSVIGASENELEPLEVEFES